MKLSFRRLLLFASLLAGFAPLAQAQASRTWVSGVGDDANPCSRTAPGKTFAGAISKTAAGGEISVLDPGGYGALTITKAITINGGGGQVASVLVSGTNGIVIQAGPNDVVILRNLQLNGIGSGVNGIRFLSGALLIIDHCVIDGFTQSGIDVALGATGKVLIQDTIISGGATGISVSTTVGTVTATLKNVTVVGSGNGIDAKAGIVSATHSTITGNSGIGAYAEGGIINLEDCLFTGNGTGVQAQTGSAVRISNVDLFHNAVGIGNGGGSVASAINNRKIGNTTAGAPNGTIAVQ